MLLGCGAQAQKHCTKNVRQSFHLVDPPHFKIVGGQEWEQETRLARAATAYSKPGPLAKSSSRQQKDSGTIQLRSGHAQGSSTLQPELRRHRRQTVTASNGGGIRCNAAPQRECYCGTRAHRFSWRG